jgi:hypothetical protein
MFIISISAVNAFDVENTTIESSDLISEAISNSNENILQSSEITVNSSSELINGITDANDGDEILIEPGTYKIHDMNITRNITLQGNGNPEDIIMDGEQQSSIFIIRNEGLHITFKNITFINAKTDGFGGAISMETGHVYVDNCIFANNTAGVNAGGISNYGNETTGVKAYLLVNNSLFINNHAGHDGGAVTTCWADSDIYNCVFINNSAERDGGAIRVSVQGYGNVQDCIFMYNHADEWGGAYYSWSGTSNIERCIFLNNTAGTYGGAVMVSGNFNMEDTIIVNNSGGLNGGSFYIQQPMYDAITEINLHNNLIANNTSPRSQEIYINWRKPEFLYPDFNDNDWGEEDPNDSSINNAKQNIPRSKVSTTSKSNLLNTSSMALLLKYGDMINGYFPEGYLDKIRQDGTSDMNPAHSGNSTDNHDSDIIGKTTNNQNVISKKNNSNSKQKNEENIVNPINSQNDSAIPATSNNPTIPASLNNQTIPNNAESQNSEATNEIAIGNSTTVGEENRAYELTNASSAAKTVTPHINFYIIPFLLIALAALIFGYKKEKAKNK